MLSVASVPGPSTPVAVRWPTPGYASTPRRLRSASGAPLNNSPKRDLRYQSDLNAAGHIQDTSHRDHAQNVENHRDHPDQVGSGKDRLVSTGPRADCRLWSTDQ